jgi:hypothetical protein
MACQVFKQLPINILMQMNPYELYDFGTKDELK